MLSCTGGSASDDTGYLIPMAVNQRVPTTENSATLPHKGSHETQCAGQINESFTDESLERHHESNVHRRAPSDGIAITSTQLGARTQRTDIGCDADTRSAEANVSAVALRKHDWPGSTRSVGCRDIRPHSAPETANAKRCARGSSCWRHARVELHYCCCCCCSGGAGRKTTVQAAAKARLAGHLLRPGRCQAGDGEVTLQHLHRRTNQHAKHHRRDLPSLPLYLDISVNEALGVYDSVHHSPAEYGNCVSRRRRNPLYWNRQQPRGQHDAHELDDRSELAETYHAAAAAAAARGFVERKLAAESRRIMLWSLLVPSLVLVAALVVLILLATKTIGGREQRAEYVSLSSDQLGEDGMTRLHDVEEKVRLLQHHIGDVSWHATSEGRSPPRLEDVQGLMSAICGLLSRNVTTEDQMKSLASCLRVAD